MLRKLRKIIEKPQSSRLKKDAVPVTEQNANENQSNPNSHSINESIEEIITPQALEANANAENQLTPCQNNQLTNAANIHAINNNLINHQIQNVQAQNVLQFSHCNSVHIGSAVTYSNDARLAGPSTVGAGPAKRIPKMKIITTNIEAMIKCDDRLERETMNIIAENLGEGWRNVIRELGFSDGRIDQMVEDHHIKGVREVIYQFLRDWNESVENATLGNISKILWKDHWEVVYLLKEYWKASRQKNGNSEKSGE